MKRQFILAALMFGVLLSSCARKERVATESAPHVTVILRDGTRVGGSILENSATKVTVAGDDGITRTIPTAQVSSIDYGSAAPAGSETAASNEAPPARDLAPTPKPVRKTADRQSAPAIPPPPPPPPTESRQRMEPYSETESHSHPAEAAITHTS